MQPEQLLAEAIRRLKEEYANRDSTNMCELCEVNHAEVSADTLIGLYAEGGYTEVPLNMGLCANCYDNVSFHLSAIEDEAIE